MRFIQACLLTALVGLGLVAPAAFAVPSGANGKIAYTKVVDKDTSNERRAIFVDGAQLTFPDYDTSGNDFDAYPTFSPDGTQIAFVRYEHQTGDYAFYTMKLKERTLLRIVGLHEFEVSQGNDALWERAVHLVWLEDGKSIAFVRKYNDNHADMVATVDVQSGAISGSWVTQGVPFDGFDWKSPTNAGMANTIITPCHAVLPTQSLFCEYGDGNLLQVTGFPAGDPYDRASWANHFVPQIMPGPDNTAPLRIMFPAVIPVSAGDHDVYLTTIYSMRPAHGNDLGGDVIEHTPDHTHEACTSSSNGQSGSFYFPRYVYADPVPSPDGKYFLASRIESAPKQSQTDSGTTTCSVEQVSNDLRVFRDDGADFRLVDNDVDTSAGVAWQVLRPNVQVQVSTGEGANRYLQGAKVELREPVDNGAVKYDAIANPGDGNYLFQGVAPGQYRVRVTLDDVQSNAYFVVNDTDTVPAWEERLVTVAPGDGVQNFGFPFNDLNYAATIVDKPHEYRLSTMSRVFYELRTFIDWLHSNLTGDTGDKVRVSIVPDPPPGENATLYNNDVMQLADKDASTLAHDIGAAPVNVEWHEFTHHLEKTFTNISCPNDINHAGYANIDTCDSLVEGFAVYLAAMAAGDPDYAGATDLTNLTKAWEARQCTNGPCSAEDFSVASLLWGLTHPQASSEFTSVFGPQHTLLPVTYQDGTAMSLRDLWAILTNSKPLTIYNLRLALDADPRFGAVTFDLDGDGVPDVSGVDQNFLMHGFFGILNQTYTPGSHPAYYYDAEAARNPASPNDGVGFSAHFSFSLNGVTYPARPVRSGIDLAPAANLSVSAHDDAGHEVQGAELMITVHYPGGDHELKRSLPAGSGNRVHLELPMYVDYLLPPDQAALPPCDPETSYYVSVTLTATVNGYSSTNTQGFDNCSYFQAQLAATDSVAASYDMKFPGDSSPPTTTITTVGTGNVDGIYADGTWTITMHCNDPVVGGFAAGCIDTQYSIDGAPYVPYGDPIVLSQQGTHTVYYMSRDASGNVEATQSVTLVVGFPADDATPPVTTANAVASVPPTGDHVTTGFWTVSLSCMDPAGAIGEQISGCDTSMYSIDGAEYANYTGPVQIHDPGRHTFSYFSYDVRGNYESPKSMQLEVAGGGQVTVPNVVGLTQASAWIAIEDAQLTVGTVTQQSSSTVPAGSVVSQSPVGGIEVTAGYAVDLVLSSGPALVSVPSVVGLTQTAASAAITGVGLVVGSVSQQSSNSIAAGSVISQSPNAGIPVASGSAVNLVVSSGPPQVSVPTVVGLAQADASAAITGAGLVVGTVTQASSNSVLSGSVISQTPHSGTSVATGTAVNLIVSSGPAMVSVPAVVGLTQAVASSAITGAGLVVGTATQQASDSIPSGDVISQSPAAGTNVAVGIAVNLVVSSGAAVGGSPFDTLKSATQAIKTTPPALKAVLLVDLATAQSLFDHGRYPAALVAMEVFVDLVRVSSGHGIAKADATNLLTLTSAVEQAIRAKIPRG